MLSCNICDQGQKSKSLEKLSAIVKKGFERYTHFRSLIQISRTLNLKNSIRAEYFLSIYRNYKVLFKGVLLLTFGCRL